MHPADRLPRELPARADVVIIGAGIVGLTLASELARAGVPRIVVFDADEPGQQSTGRSAGGIRRQFGSELEIQLTQAALRFYEPIFADPDFDGRFERDGYVFLAGQEQHRQLYEACQLQRGLGVPTEWLDRHALAERYPYLDVSNLSGGTFCADDGVVDPGSIVQWLVRRCDDLGVIIRTQRRVHAIEVSQQRVRAVCAGPDRIEAPTVINAAGAWAGVVGALAGVAVPVLPSRRFQLITETEEALLPRTPLMIDLTTGAYLRATERRIMAGVSPATIPIGFEVTQERETVDLIAAHASARFPGLRRAGVSRIAGGLYEITPDGLPIAGFAKDVAGFGTVAGFNGHGIMHSPPLACAIADLILGRPERFGLEPFKPDRFAAGADAAGRHSGLI